MRGWKSSKTPRSKIFTGWKWNENMRQDEIIGQTYFLGGPCVFKSVMGFTSAALSTFRIFALLSKNFPTFQRRFYSNEKNRDRWNLKRPLFDMFSSAKKRENNFFFFFFTNIQNLGKKITYIRQYKKYSEKIITKITTLIFRKWEKKDKKKHTHTQTDTRNFLFAAVRKFYRCIEQ